MTNQQLQSNLKQMAEFMGMNLDHLEHEEGMDHNWTNPPKGLHWSFESPPPFNTSSDWLLPVIYKFRDLSDEHEDNNNAKEHFDKWSKIKRAFFDAKTLPEGITRAFELLSEGIEWFNQLKNKYEKEK